MYFILAKRLKTLEALELLANGNLSHLDFSDSSNGDFNTNKIYEDSSEAENEANKESVNNFAEGSISQANANEIRKYQKSTLILKNLGSKFNLKII